MALLLLLLLLLLYLLSQYHLQRRAPRLVADEVYLVDYHQAYLLRPSPPSAHGRVHGLVCGHHDVRVVDLHGAPGGGRGPPLAGQPGSRDCGIGPRGPVLLLLLLLLHLPEPPPPPGPRHLYSGEGRELVVLFCRKRPERAQVHHAPSSARQVREDGKRCYQRLAACGGRRDEQAPPVKQPRFDGRGLRRVQVRKPARLEKFSGAGRYRAKPG